MGISLLILIAFVLWRQEIYAQQKTENTKKLRCAAPVLPGEFESRIYSVQLQQKTAGITAAAFTIPVVVPFIYDSENVSGRWYKLFRFNQIIRRQ